MSRFILTALLSMLAHQLPPVAFKNLQPKPAHVPPARILNRRQRRAQASGKRRGGSR